MTVILEVEHITTYRYAQAVRFGEDRVALHPRTAHDIQNEGLPVDPDPDAKFYPFDRSADHRYDLANFLRFDQCFKPSPAHDLLHFAEELLAPRLAFFLGELAAGKAQLLGRLGSVLHGFSACRNRAKLISVSLMRFSTGSSTRCAGTARQC